MSKQAELIYLRGDPLDRWVRLTTLAAAYGEPESSLRELVDNGQLTAKRRGAKLLYVNERQYQNYLGELPNVEPKTKAKSQPRGNIGAAAKRVSPLSDEDRKAAHQREGG